MQSLHRDISIAFVYIGCLNPIDMAANTELINSFYTAFQSRDYMTMQACYADDATFSDPVFTNLSSTEVKAMWEMFCVKGKELSIHFEDVTATSDGATANWTAKYQFSATRNYVVNHIHADFIIRNGKIVRHVDTFNFYRWVSQALGFPGMLLGWTPFMKHRIRSGARRSLNLFMNR